MRILKSNFEKAAAKVKSYTKNEIAKLESTAKNVEYKKLSYTSEKRDKKYSPSPSNNQVKIGMEMSATVEIQNHEISDANLDLGWTNPSNQNPYNVDPDIKEEMYELEEKSVTQKDNEVKLKTRKRKEVGKNMCPVNAAANKKY